MDFLSLLQLDTQDLSIEREEIVSLLKRTGLTDYEAKAYLALVMKAHATAEEVAEVSDIPRTSTYKVLESLTQKGFATARGGRPVVYHPSPPREVKERLLIDLDRTFRKLEHLHGVLSERGTPQLVYTITEKNRILAKIGEMLDASEETVLISSPALRDILAEHSGRIANAIKRGVKVTVVAEPSVKVPENAVVIRKPDLLATDVIVDSERAMIASPDLSICGYSDNPFLAAHFEHFIVMANKDLQAEAR